MTKIALGRQTRQNQSQLTAARTTTWIGAQGNPNCVGDNDGWETGAVVKGRKRLAGQTRQTQSQLTASQLGKEEKLWGDKLKANSLQVEARFQNLESHYQQLELKHKHTQTAGEAMMGEKRKQWWSTVETDWEDKVARLKAGSAEKAESRSEQTQSHHKDVSAAWETRMMSEKKEGWAREQTDWENKPVKIKVDTEQAQTKYREKQAAGEAKTTAQMDEFRSWPYWRIV
jgi:hypothetical protein